MKHRKENKMAYCSSEPSEPLRVQDMSYDEFCIAAFDKDVDELRNQNKKQNGKLQRKIRASNISNEQMG